MYSLILIGLISKFQNTSDFRYQRECGTAWTIILFENITAVSPGGRHENIQITMLRNSGRFIENFREMIFIKKNPNTKFVLFLLQVKEMNMSKRKSLFFYFNCYLLKAMHSQERILLPGYIEMLQLLLREIVSICLSLFMF